MKIFKNNLLLGLIAGLFVFTSCDKDEPGAENEEEVINEVTLTFTSDADGSTVTATYLDTDGDGTIDPTIDTIALTVGTVYGLGLELSNSLETPAEDITSEIQMEDDEHQFFFSWTANLFTDPTGTGNIGASGTVNYQDPDGNGNPLGLSTLWTTSNDPLSGTFTIQLQHQPGVKTATSTSADGDTDISIDFPIVISQ